MNDLYPPAGRTRRGSGEMPSFPLLRQRGSKTSNTKPPPLKKGDRGGFEMGKWKEHPRYNVLSLRCSDEELAAIRAALKPNEHMGDMLKRAAIAQANSRQLLAAYREQTCS